MNSKPATFREEIVNGKFIKTMILISSMLTVAILGIFGFSKENLIHAQTLVFTAVVLYELIRIIAIRSEYHLPIFSNKFLWLAMTVSLGLQLLVLYLPISFSGTTLQNLFKVQPLGLLDWAVLLGVGLILLLVMKTLTLTYKTKLS